MSANRTGADLSRVKQLFGRLCELWENADHEYLRSCSETTCKLGRGAEPTWYTNKPKAIAELLDKERSLDLLPQLRLFLEVGRILLREPLSFHDVSFKLVELQEAGRIGQKLVTSQASITRCISELEGVFRVTLVDRPPGLPARGLTAAGMKLWECTRDLLDFEVAHWIRRLQALWELE